jgi:hypothetical protein
LSTARWQLDGDKLDALLLLLLLLLLANAA